MDASQLSVTLVAHTEKAQARLEWLRNLPPAVQRFIPIDLATWWVLRALKVELK